MYSMCGMDVAYKMSDCCQARSMMVVVVGLICIRELSFQCISQQIVCLAAQT